MSNVYDVDRVECQDRSVLEYLVIRKGRRRSWQQQQQQQHVNVKHVD
jgi:hypothetical protein